MALDKDGKKQLPKGISWRADKSLYMARFTFQGQSYTLYDKDLKSIKKKLTDKKYEVEHGLSGKADKLTLNVWYDQWLRQYKIPHIKETSIRAYTQMYSCYIRPTLGTRQLAQIKPVHIQKLVNDWQAQKLAPKTISNIYGVVYDIFETALNNDLILKHPCRGVTLPKPDKKERRVLTVDEQKKLLEYLESNDKWRPFHPLVLVLLGTGLRIGECLGLTWDCVDFEESQIKVIKTLVYVKDINDNVFRFKFQPPKTHASERIIPMLPEVRAALLHQRDILSRLKQHMSNSWQPLEGFQDVCFCTFKGTPLMENAVRKVLIDVVDKINSDEGTTMEHISPHGLRHSFATRCIERGIPQKTAQELVVHSALSLTMDLYVHTTVQTKGEDIKRLEGILT